MSERCKGKNCKHTHGFDIPHSPECQLQHEAAYQQDNSCGPNNINVLNPDQDDVSSLGSAEYMKLLVLAMVEMGIEEVVITPQLIEECDNMDALICIANMEDGIHLSFVSREEADKIAKDQRGSIN
jgi:hypothetical protein